VVYPGIATVCKYFFTARGFTNLHVNWFCKSDTCTILLELVWFAIEFFSKFTTKLWCFVFFANSTKSKKKEKIVFSKTRRENQIQHRVVKFVVVIVVLLLCTIHFSHNSIIKYRAIIYLLPFSPLWTDFIAWRYLDFKSMQKRLQPSSWCLSASMWWGKDDIRKI